MEHKLNLSATEHKDLTSYCNLNDLLISEVVKKSFTTGFNIERYGLINMGGIQEKQVEKEVIVEKRVEIPVEVIKEVVKIEYVEVEKPIEVEVIKEVPVDRVVEKIVEIIKEVPVEKIVYVTDQEEMSTKIFQKEQEFEQKLKIFSTKMEEMKNIFQNEKSELLLKIQELESKEPEIKEVVREVVVEKETTDNSLKPKLDALQNTIQKLKQDNIEKDKQIREYEQTIKDIQTHQQGTKALYLKGSNLDEKLYKK